MNAAEDFSPETALFIGNKWENIPESDRTDVRNEIYRKLNNVYPGITEDQIHFMSVMKVPDLLFLQKNDCLDMHW